MKDKNTSIAGRQSSKTVKDAVARYVEENYKGATIEKRYSYAACVSPKTRNFKIADFKKK
jgi:hypothetical protein